MEVDLTDEQLALIQEALAEYEYMNRATSTLPATKWSMPLTLKRFKETADKTRKLRQQLEKNLIP